MSPDPTARLGPDPDAIAGQTFTRSRKGFEADEVRAFLVGLASQVRKSQRNQADVTRRLAELERRSADPRELDVAEVSELLGEETARVLDTARKAAVEIRTKADQYAADVTSRTDAEATETRRAADEYDTTTRSDGDEYAHVTRHAAEDDADVTRSAAAQESVRVRAEAERVLVERTSEAETAAAATRAEADAYAEHARAEADAYAATTRAGAESYRAEEQQAADAYRQQARAEADAYSESTRAAADSYRAEQHQAGDAYRAEATADGEQARAAVEAEVAQVRAAAEAAVAEGRVGVQAEAEAILEAARRQGRSMVDEARDYRERVIVDLADRRRAARALLDQLAASRDSLSVTLTDVAGRIEASHYALSTAAIASGGLGDVAADRAALPERPLPEELDAPAPEVSSGEFGATADAEIDDGVVQDVDDGGAEDTTEVDSAGDDPSPASLAEPDVADSTSETELDASDVGATMADEVAAVVGTEAVAVDPAIVDPGTVDPEPIVDPEPVDDPGATNDVDRAAALFAQLKAATNGNTPVSALDAMVDESTATARAGKATVSVRETENLESDGHSEPFEAAVDEPTGSPDESGDAGDEPGRGGPDVDLLDRRDATTDELERQLARRLKRVLSDEQNEALDRLRRVRGTAQADQVLVSEDDHRERYRAAAAEDLASAERAGAGFFGEAPGKPAPIDDVAEAFASDLVRALRGRLEAAIQDGGEEQEIGERIRACYREWKTQRIADVARHYIQVAFGRGVAGFESDTPTRWLVDHAGAAAPDCDDNSLAGVVDPGQPFPTGDLHPPVHPGCRCLAVPAAT